MVNTIDKSWIFHTFSTRSWKNLQRSSLAPFPQVFATKMEGSTKRERERERRWIRLKGPLTGGQGDSQSHGTRASLNHYRHVWATSRFDAESLLEKELMEWLECLLQWPLLVPPPEPDVHTGLPGPLRVTNLWEELPLSSLSINYRSWSDVSTVCLDFSFHLFFLSFFFGFVRKLRLEKWGVIFFSIRFRNLEIAEEETWKEMRRRHFQIEILN